MNQITTRYVTENGACYEQYVITDAEAKTELVITPERGGMITGFSLNGEEYIWTRHPNFSECNRPRFGVPVLFPNCGLPDNGVHIFDGKAYPMENHGFADLCAWDVESVGPDGVTLILESTPLTKFLYPFDFTVLMNYNLEGMTKAEGHSYINAKLKGAGCTQTVFEENALEAILNAANGTPRMINKLCNASLLVGNSANLNIITADAVMQAINDCELG